jgi:hypothetical protein
MGLRTVVESGQFTWGSVGDQRQRVVWLEPSGYRVVFDRDGYVVLRRGGPAAGSGHTRRPTI